LPEGHTLEEMIVSYIGKLGENISLSTAKIICTEPSTEIISHTHPSGKKLTKYFKTNINVKRNMETSKLVDMLLLWP